MNTLFALKKKHLEKHDFSLSFWEQDGKINAILVSVR